MEISKAAVGLLIGACVAASASGAYMVTREIAHERLPDLRIVSSMHERKAMMADLADAFLALPGGFGTFEEFCEVVTWTQLGLHRKRCGLLNVEGFYDPLLSLVDRAVTDGFIKPENRSIVVAGHDPEALLDRLAEPVTAGDYPWLRAAEEA